MSKRVIVLCMVAAVCTTALAGPLVTGVRMKLSAGDLASGIAAVEDYKRDTGVDAEYLNAVGWLARGAEMLRQRELAEKYVAELHREIPAEKEGLTTPFGAAIEVESRLILARDGRGEALRYLASALDRAEDPALRSRINKNIHLLSLEGRPALSIDNTDFVGNRPATAASRQGKVTVLFLWAHWCGDCRVQAPVLTRLWQRYRDKGLVLIAPTRYYGSVDEKKVDPPRRRKGLRTSGAKRTPDSKA